MKKFDELRKEWIVTIKTLKSLSTQTLYFLLEPDDDNKFFKSIDSFKDCIEGTQFTDFQMLAIEYLLEYKRQNKPIKSEPYKLSNTGKWPFGPLDDEQIQQCTKPNTIPNITPDNITSASIAPGISADFVRYVGKPACRCTDCELFDGYDICCHPDNFSSITQKTLDNCKNLNLFKEKLYGT